MKTVKIFGKSIPLLAIVAIVIIGLVSAAVLVSNILILVTEVKDKPPYPLDEPILISQMGFPTVTFKGELYTFKTNTKNMDPNFGVTDITTTIVIDAVNDLAVGDVTITYEDDAGSFTMVFTVNGEGNLISSIGPWNAPVDYDNDAKYTFLVDLDAPLGIYTTTIKAETP